MIAAMRLLLCWSALALVVSGQTAVPTGVTNDKQHLLMEKAEQRSLEIAQHLDGVVGIGVKDFTSGESWFLHGDEIFPTASTIKLTILLELYHQVDQGRLSLDEKVRIRKAMTVGDEGLLSQFGDGTAEMSLHDVAAAMILLSENSATNILIDRLGMANINAEARAIGLQHTVLQRKMIDLAAARAGRENISTAPDLLLLLQTVHAGKALSPASTRGFLDLLEVPKDSEIAKGIPDGVKVGSKPGWLEGVRNDCAVVEVPGRPYGLCVFTTFDRDEMAAMAAIRALSHVWYEYFARVAVASAYGRAIPR